MRVNHCSIQQHRQDSDPRSGKFLVKINALRINALPRLPSAQTAPMLENGTETLIALLPLWELSVR
jgi:hypothetical protein